MPVYSSEELRQREESIRGYLLTHFSLTNPVLLERQYGDGDFGYEVEGFSLPSISPKDHIDYIEDAQVRIGVHPPLPHETDHSDRKKTPSPAL